MALSKVPKLFVCANKAIPTPEGYDRAWTVHEAFFKMDIISYNKVLIDENISQVYLTAARPSRKAAANLDAWHILWYSIHTVGINPENINVFIPEQS